MLAQVLPAPLLSHVSVNEHKSNYLSPTRETKTELLTPGFSLAPPRSEQQLESQSFSLSLSAFSNINKSLKKKRQVTKQAREKKKEKGKRQRGVKEFIQAHRASNWQNEVQHQVYTD